MFSAHFLEQKTGESGEEALSTNIHEVDSLLSDLIRPLTFPGISVLYKKSPRRRFFDPILIFTYVTTY